MRLLLLAFVLFCTSGDWTFAQAPNAELIRLTEKHDVDVKAINVKRDAATKGPREAYIVALNDAEAVSRKTERITEVVAIEAERTAFEKNTFAATNPGLPPKLTGLRAKFLAANALADKQFKPSLDAVNNTYLTALNTMEAAAKKDKKADLAKEVAAAKAKFLGVPEEKDKDKTKPAKKAPDEPKKKPAQASTDGKSLVPNSDFSQRDPADKDHAAGWNYTPGKAVSLVTEGDSQFMRLDSSAGSSSGFNQKFPLPDKTTGLKVSIRARIAQLEINKDEAGKPKGRPSFFGWVQDAAGSNLKGFIIHLDRVTGGWETFESTCSVPSGGTQLSVTCDLMKSKGIVDIDDVRIVKSE